MSGDAGNLGMEPGGTLALGQPGYGGVDQEPKTHTSDDGGEVADVNSPTGKRRIHRVGVSIVVSVFVLAYAGYLALLAYGTYWVVHQVPL